MTVRTVRGRVGRMPKPLRLLARAGRFERVVEALVGAMARQAEGGYPSPDQVAATTAFLVGTHRQMPDYLRLALGSLTLVFDVSSYATSGCPFHRLSLERRQRQIAAWERSRFGPGRQLMLYYRSLVTFSLYSDRHHPSA